MVDVKKRCLCALKQDRCPFIKRVVQQVHRVAEVRQEPARILVVSTHDVVDVKQLFTERSEQIIFLGCTLLDERTESLAVAHVARTHADALHFVGICGPDSLKRGAEF